MFSFFSSACPPVAQLPPSRVLIGDGASFSGDRLYLTVEVLESAAGSSLEPNARAGLVDDVDALRADTGADVAADRSTAAWRLV